MAGAQPITPRSPGGWGRAGLLAVAIALIGLLVAGGLGLTHQANDAHGADRDVMSVTPAPGDHLVAVTAGSGGLTPAGHGNAPQPAGRPAGSGGSSSDGGSSSPASSAGDGPAPSPAPSGSGAAVAPAPAAAGTVTTTATEGSPGYLDSGAAVAAKAANGPAAPDFDRALVDLSAAQRVADQQARAEQETRENTSREQAKRVAAQADAAKGIRTEQTRLVDEKNRAAAEAALLQAQQAALEAGKLSGDTGIRLPDGTLVRPLADGSRPASVPAELNRLGRTIGAATGRTLTPIARGQYTVGARWGAVGTWASYHTGVDFGAPIGTPVRAAADGTVTVPVAGDWAGTHVILTHTDGSTLYAHLLASTVRPGQKVKAGDIIGFVGLTGRTFGPHLHFEYYPRGGSLLTPYSATDPLVWLASRGVAP